MDIVHMKGRISINKPPAFQFYPKDFLMDDKVIVMNLEEIGVYIKLLCFCWNNNGLTKNQKELKNMCGNPNNWESIWVRVSKCFYEKKGKLYNKRLEKEYRKQKAWRKKSQLGGIKSGISRGKKDEPKLKGGSQIVQTKTQPKGNTSSAFSSASLKKSLKEKTVSQNKIYETAFKEFWEAYPNKIAKEYTKEKFMILMRKGELENVQKAFTGYMDYLKHKRVNENFKQAVLNPATFLMKNRWREFINFRYKARL